MSVLFILSEVLMDAYKSEIWMNEINILYIEVLDQIFESSFVSNFVKKIKFLKSHVKLISKIDFLNGKNFNNNFAV